MRCFLLTYLCVLFGLNIGWTQDIHFTQLNASPLAVNPAFTGLYSGWERVGISHKNQWINAGTKFLTTALVADFNVFKSPRQKGAYLGVGLQLYNDVGGDSKFGAKQVLASVSGIVPLAEKSSFAVGLQAGMGHRSGSYRNLLFPNQFDGEALNPKLNAYEYAGLNSNIYPDISFGILYQYGGVRKTLATKDETVFNIGFSVYHVNKPKIDYSFGAFETLGRKYVFNTSFKKDFPGSYVGIEALINTYRQLPHNELLMAALLRYRASSGSRVSGLRKKLILSLGMAYRVNDAIAPMFKMENGNWSFGLSYDITISKLGTFKRGGGIEFSMVYQSADFAIFKRR